MMFLTALLLAAMLFATLGAMAVVLAAVTDSLPLSILTVGAFAYIVVCGTIYSDMTGKPSPLSVLLWWVS